MDLAGNDPSRFEEILNTRLTEGLEAYILRAKEEALDHYRHEQSLFVAGGLRNKPKLPRILQKRK